VDSSSIAVTASERGVVTLKGSVPTYLQSRNAERAAKRVRGVQAVANDVEVKPAPGFTWDDAGIAEAALQAIRWSTTVPQNAVKLTVSSGWITLEGRLGWDYQRRSAELAVRDLRGVRGISNLIEVEPTAKPADVKRKIEDAFRRSAEIDAQRVSVDAVGGRVTLRGTVPTWSEKEAASRAAYSAPGVTSVENRVEMRSPAFVA
jgi:osmotically-inducible protein OsmY